MPCLPTAVLGTTYMGLGDPGSTPGDRQLALKVACQTQSCKGVGIMVHAFSMRSSCVATAFLPSPQKAHASLPGDLPWVGEAAS